MSSFSLEIHSSTTLRQTFHHLRSSLFHHPPQWQLTSTISPPYLHPPPPYPLLNRHISMKPSLSNHLASNTSFVIFPIPSLKKHDSHIIFLHAKARLFEEVGSLYKEVASSRWATKVIRASEGTFKTLLLLLLLLSFTFRGGNKLCRVMFVCGWDTILREIDPTRKRCVRLINGTCQLNPSTKILINW